MGLAVEWRRECRFTAVCFSSCLWCVFSGSIVLHEFAGVGESSRRCREQVTAAAKCPAAYRDFLPTAGTAQGAGRMLTDALVTVCPSKPEMTSLESAVQGVHVRRCDTESVEQYS